MDVSVEKIGEHAPELAIIRCREVTERIADIINYIKASDASLAGYTGDRMTQIYLQDIFYVEAVDNRVFAYTAAKTYELRSRLYEFERMYEDRRFFRCSKSMVVNLMKIDSVSPILSGRLSARLFNGEEVLISRQYVSRLKKHLSGGDL